MKAQEKYIKSSTNLRLELQRGGLLWLLPILNLLDEAKPLVFDKNGDFIKWGWKSFFSPRRVYKALVILTKIIKIIINR